MKPFKFTINITTLCLGAVLFFVSCKKDDPEPEDPTPDPSGKFFQWQVNGGKVVTADSTYAIQGNTIFAFKNSGEGIEVNLSALTSNTYQISSSSGNQLEYNDGSNSYTGSGTFMISSADGNKLDGHFNCSLTGGNLSSITGTFSEVPKW